MIMKEYLIRRFMYNNHNKYRKYAEEWVEHLTHEQIAYFILEKERLEKHGGDFTEDTNR